MQLKFYGQITLKRNNFRKYSSYLFLETTEPLKSKLTSTFLNGSHQNVYIFLLIGNPKWPPQHDIHVV